ncbi:hypothetical protein [Variovorax paradoxus]|uniref:hypothetical protein n=1 Tax=Variovorax paradoxus TaxID=34073 RepID=UPI0033916B7F
MNNEEFWNHQEKLKALASAAWADALASLKAMNLPCTVDLPLDVPELSPLVRETYGNVHAALWDKFEDQVPRLVGYAISMAWFAWHYQAHCDKQPHWASEPFTPTGRGRDSNADAKHGLVQLAFEFASAEDFGELAEFAALFGFDEPPACEDVLLCLEAQRLASAGSADLSLCERFTALHDAGIASALRGRLISWEAGRLWESVQQAERQTLNKTRSAALDEARATLAKVGASARHALNRRTKATVIERYQAEREKFANKNDAAFFYMKEFAMEFVTIREWLKGV